MGLHPASYNQVPAGILLQFGEREEKHQEFPLCFFEVCYKLGGLVACLKVKLLKILKFEAQ